MALASLTCVKQPSRFINVSKITQQYITSYATTICSMQISGCVAIENTKPSITLLLHAEQQVEHGPYCRQDNCVILKWVSTLLYCLFHFTYAHLVIDTAV